MATSKLRFLILPMLLICFLPLVPAQTYYQLKDINPGVGGSNIGTFTVMKDKVYFLAEDETDQTQIWVTNGLESETFKVSDLTITTYNSGPIAISDSLLIFTVHESSIGKELYSSDGTLGSESLILDLLPGPQGSISQFGKGDGQLAYFRKSNNGLYRTDGTANGTIELFSEASGFGRLMKYHGDIYTRLHFSGYTWLLRTDGTQQGTEIITKIQPQYVTYSTVGIESIKDSLFTLKIDDNDSWGLWKTDGTVAGLEKVVTLTPPGLYNANSLVSTDDQLFFIANDGINGAEIYVSDGTPSGTQIIADLIHVDSVGAAGSSLTTLNDVLLFKREGNLWISNGTPSGTHLLKEFESAVNSVTFDFSEYLLVDSIIYFRASTISHGNELWRTDATEEGTYMLTDICPGPCGAFPHGFTKMDDYRIIFKGRTNSGGTEPWIYEYKTPPPVGVNSQINELKNELKVYPNPAFDENVIIEWSPDLKPFKMEIIDMTGRVVKNKKIDLGSNSMNIKIQNLPSGTYSVFLRKSSGEIIENGKLNIF